VRKVGRQSCKFVSGERSGRETIIIMELAYREMRYLTIVTSEKKGSKSPSCGGVADVQELGEVVDMYVTS
jgi:hypothetical protein